jgi:hypothetical protein
MMERKPNFSAEDVRRIANSTDAQKLMTLLQRNNSEQLKNAMSQASAGDYVMVRKTLSDALADPEVRALLERIGGQYGG